MTTFAFETDEERYRAVMDFQRATENLFGKPLSDEGLKIADGWFQRWRQRNRTGRFYWNDPEQAA